MYATLQTVLNKINIYCEMPESRFGSLQAQYILVDSSLHWTQGYTGHSGSVDEDKTYEMYTQRVRTLQFHDT
jgi:hypothetical protein